MEAGDLTILTVPKALSQWAKQKNKEILYKT
jgi:hypothetical protein